MSTTARIHFAQATAGATKGEAIWRARHAPPAATLWVVEEGAPRIHGGRGILDRLELFFTTKTMEPSFCHARQLAGQFVSLMDREASSTESTIYPSTPTVAPPVFYEYLVLCHGHGIPDVLVRRPGVWMTEDDFKSLEPQEACVCGSWELVTHCGACRKER